MLHKPAGYVTTMADPQGRRQVTDLLAGQEERLFPVGRLDYDATGLLLLTNNGELANRLMHPRYKVPKTYRVTVAGLFDEMARKRLLSGIMLDGRRSIPQQVRVSKKLAGTQRGRIDHPGRQVSSGKKDAWPKSAIR